MTTEAERWIEAGKILAVDPKATVSCPRCQDANIAITDISMQGDPGFIERHMQCPKCGAYNALRLRR